MIIPKEYFNPNKNPESAPIDIAVNLELGFFIKLKVTIQKTSTNTSSGSKI
jgi:hypothetical protein